MKKSPTGKKYSEAFKRQVVRDLERERTTAAEVARRYSVTGGATIDGWLCRYGTDRVAGRGSGAKRQKTV